MRLRFASCVAVALLSACGDAGKTVAPPDEATVIAKFVEVARENPWLADHINLASVRVLSAPERVHNDFMDGNSGVGFKWCLVLQPKDGVEAAKVAGALMQMRKTSASASTGHESLVARRAASWADTRAFLVAATHGVGRNWDKEDPWTFGWNSFENVC